MSHPPDVKKQYGIVSAIGTKVGEKARSRPDLIAAIRATSGLDEFRAKVREVCTDVVPPALLTTFLDDIVKEADWQQWRSRLLLQAKMVRDGAKPAEDHRSGKGVGGP
jgi:hypothetical protein